MTADGTDRAHHPVVRCRLPTQRGGLAGALVRIVTGSGAGQYHTIASNTAHTITIVGEWTTSGSYAMAVDVKVAVLEMTGVTVPRQVVRVEDDEVDGVIVRESDGRHTAGRGRRDRHLHRATHQALRVTARASR